MGEIVFWEVAVDVEKGKVLEQFDCPHCRSILNKKKIESQNVTSFDLSEKENMKKAGYSRLFDCGNMVYIK